MGTFYDEGVTMLIDKRLNNYLTTNRPVLESRDSETRFSDNPDLRGLRFALSEGDDFHTFLYRQFFIDKVLIKEAQRRGSLSSPYLDSEALSSLYLKSSRKTHQFGVIEFTKDLKKYYNQTSKEVLAQFKSRMLLLRGQQSSQNLFKKIKKCDLYNNEKAANSLTDYLVEQLKLRDYVDFTRNALIQDPKSTDYGQKKVARATLENIDTFDKANKKVLKKVFKRLEELNIDENFLKNYAEDPYQGKKSSSKKMFHKQKDYKNRPLMKDIEKTLLSKPLVSKKNDGVNWWLEVDKGGSRLKIDETYASLRPSIVQQMQMYK